MPLQYSRSMPQRSRTTLPGGKPVSEMLKSRSSGLGQLLKHARKLEQLDQKLANILEPDISGRVRVAALHDHRLVLITPSAALATRLRLDSEDLLKALQAVGVKGISQIQIRTAPLSQVEVIQRRKRQLPEIGRKSLQRFARDSGDDEILDLVRRRQHDDGDG